MGLFFILTLYILLLAAIFKKQKKIFLFCTFSLFFALSALRSVNIGNDTSDYKLLFENLKFMPVENFTWRFETGYLYFNKFIQIFFENSQSLFVISAFIVCLGYAMLINKFSKIVWLSVYLFFTLRYFDLSMNILRQSLAMVILFLGFYILIKEKNILYFIILVFLASLFHNTAIVFLVVAILKKIKNEKRYIAFLSLITLVGLFSFNTIFSFVLRFFPTYSYYLNSSYMDGNTRVATILNILVNLVILLFVYICKFEKNKVNNLMFHMLMFGISITVISLRFSLLDRVSDFFTVYSIILIPNALSFTKQTKNIKLFLIYIILICFFIYYLVIIIYRPDWNRVYPYEFFWNSQ